MSKPLQFPKPVHHKRSGQSVLFLKDENGSRRSIYLGPHGSQQAAVRYREVLAAHLAGKPLAALRPSVPATSAWPTVAQLCASFLLFADSYYRDAEGRLSKGVRNYPPAFAPLLELHRDLHTDQLSVAHLVDVRDRMAASGKLCRITINGRLALLKQLVKWGTERRLVPGSVWHEVSALRGLPHGRSGVRENPPVEAVPWHLVEQTLPHLVPTLRAAVLVQWQTGMRPAELLTMTRRQLDMSGRLWVYKPTRHKGSWRGRERVVRIGPKAQQLIAPMLPLAPDAAIFSPTTAWHEYRAELRERRKSPTTSQTKERDERQEEQECLPFFDVSTYRRAIHRACDRCEIPRWSPHRLRHAAGTRLVLEVGLEAARAVLGHSDSRMTRRYSIAADDEMAASVMARHG
jgi:integrase